MRVLVTRAAPDAARTATALMQLGHEAVLAPVTAIRRTGVAIPQDRFDAVAATSHHAFEELDDRITRRLPVFAVGHRTAEAARAAGFRDVRIGAGDAENLATLLRLTLPRSSRLLYLAGRDRKPALEAAVTAAGYALAVVELYAAEPVERWPEAACTALRQGGVDAALHYSRRGTALTLDLARRAGIEDAFLRLRHLCLSDDVAAPLVERSAASVVVADRPDEDRLLALLSPPTG